MNKETFENLKTKAGEFAFSSFEYLEYEHVAAYQVIADSPELIVVFGHNDSAGCGEVYWAANDPQTLLAAIRERPCPVLVTFVPEAWKALFHEQGFKEYGILREYWTAALQDPGQPLKVCSPLAESEYAHAAEVTVSCRDQSREFHGETAEWIAGWMRGEDPDASACGSRDCTILACRKNGQPVGVVCVAIYGDKSAKGPVVWIREIAVMPEYQGQGCGKALLQSALAYGLEHGAKRAFLMADDCNTGAITLYRRMGFEPNMSEAQIDLIYETTD